ncbi:MAG: DUF4010 domain-containing protein [Bacteroidales bacterium]|jgi:uncharacterized membrane protein (DUF4010 family)|nr:DUF4010 domain-containing protein [Bacteroidales bacterium]
MQEYIQSLPPNLIDFFLVTVFSLLIGLSQRKINLQTDSEKFFGSDRTFTLIGILGFILYVLEPDGMMLFAGGGLLLGILLGVNYYFKLSQFQSYGITSIVIAFLTYCIAPLVITQPLWLTLLVVVTILLITEMKETFTNFAKQLNNDEFVNLAKFILITGIILPMLPNDPIIEGISLTPYKIWLATVVISTISYSSYLLHKFVFPKSGIILSGVLGGIYSSTATVIILAKKCKVAPEGEVRQYAAAVMAAISTMYVRVLVLLSIFNQELFTKLLVYFVIMIAICALIALFLHIYKRDKQVPHEDIETKVDENPLEFKVALLFAALFVVFTIITKYTIEYFGTQGLNVLSIIVGVTDITPFLLNLFEGGYAVSNTAISMATFQAIISSNVSKVFFGIAFSGNRKTFSRLLLGALGFIVVFNIVLLFFM